MRMPHVNLSPVTLVETFGFYLLIVSRPSPNLRTSWSSSPEFGSR